MIVIGLDVHKQSVTAVAVDEAGRPLEEKLIPVGSDELLDWAAALDRERLWAVEDCRQLTGWLERQLLSVGEDVVRVPPKLTVPERRAGRTRGKSDPIDALAIARAAIREPDLSRPRPTSASTGRSSCWSTTATISSISAGAPSSGCVGISSSSTRPTSCRCGCSAAPPTWSASAAGSPAGRRSCRCGSRASSSPAAASSTGRSPSSTRSSSNESQIRRPGCSSCPAAPRSPPPSCSPRSARSTASDPTRSSPATAASHPWKSKLRTHPAPPPRPRRQPPTQRRPLPNRDHPGPLPRPGTRLPRTQTRRRQEPTRSDPLPQTTAHPRRLQHTQSVTRLDIGATLAQAVLRSKPQGSQDGGSGSAASCTSDSTSRAITRPIRP